MLDLDKLWKKLEDALAKETPESLTLWLDEQRRKDREGGQRKLVRITDLKSIEMDMEKEEKAARRRHELREELESLGLLGRAASEFGLEYLKSEETSRTPHPMSELDQRIADMGLTNRELFRMGQKSYNHVGPFTDFPFEFNAEYFAGDKDGLVSIDNETMDNYVKEVLKDGDDDGFIDWLDREGLVGEGWAARAESHKITTLSLPQEELRTLLFATERAIEITKDEVGVGGITGAAARLNLPKYSKMYDLLFNAIKGIYPIEEAIAKNKILETDCWNEGNKSI